MTGGDSADHTDRAKAVRPRRRRGRVRSMRRRIPPLSVMPTLITLGNLVAGFAAIHFAARSSESDLVLGWSTLTLAGALIFLGMFLDAIDGTVARITRSTSELGAQLDSLCDLVTFGVAPAFLMLRLVSHYVGPEGEGVVLGPDADSTLARIIWGIAAVYICCTALRLARFNVETPSAAAEDHLVFRGLPSPAAAGTVVSLVLLHEYWLHSPRAIVADQVSLDRLSALGIPLVALLCAIAMVSSLPWTHVVNRYLGGRRSFAYIVRIVVPLFLAIWWFQETLAACFVIYALSSPVRRGWLVLKRWRAG